MGAGKAYWLFALALPVTPAFAETADGLDLSGTMRVRYEAIGNQARTGFAHDDDFVSLRTTLMAHYQSGAFSLTGELWDSRVHGDRPGSAVTTGEVNTIEPVQAYVGLKGAIGHARVSAQAGRFMVNIGSRRLVAADDYRNTTNGYTGLKLDVAAPGGVTGTAIYVLPQQRRPDDTASLHHNRRAFDHEGFDLVLWGGTAAKAKAWGAVAAEASFYHLGERDQPGRPTRDRSLDTYGGRLIREPAGGQWDGELEALYQSGTISALTAPGAARQQVAAWFVHAAVGYTIEGALNAHLSLQYDRASGDGPGGSYGRFDTLFGMRRGDFAPAGLYNAIARTNLSTPMIRAEITPSPRWDAFVSYRALWLADRSDSFSATGVRDATGHSGNFAGHQIDTRLRWWLRPARLRFEVDGTFFAKGRFLEDAPNAPAGGTTAYGSVNLSAFF